MRHYTSRRQYGLSALELLIGMVLGVILVSGATASYLASKRSYLEVEQFSFLAENAQFAERILTDSLRHAGFFGEVQFNRIEVDSALTAVASDCTGPAAAYALQSYVFAAVADADGEALGCITDAVPGSHVLVVKSVQPQPLSDGPRGVPADPDIATQGDGVIDTPLGLAATQTYIMTNDTLGVLFDGADTPPSITDGGAVPRGVAWAYQYEVFYVRAGAIPQLSRKTLLNIAGTATVVTEDLVEGVEEMRMRFGVDGVAGVAGEVDIYTAVTAMGTNWNQVQSIEIALLVRAPGADPAYNNSKSYQLAGSTITPADNFRRVLVMASISLRNPKLVIRGSAA